MSTIDRVLLRDLMVDHFGPNDLRSICFDLGIEETDLGPGSLRNRFEALIEEQRRRGRLPLLIEINQKMRPTVDWGQLFAKNGSAINFPFTNRESEIDLIMYEIPSHRVIQAPMGYGKTALCEKIQSRFHQPSWRDDWICRYVLVKPDEFDLLAEFKAASFQLKQESPNSLVLIFDLDRHRFRSVFSEKEINLLAGFEERLRGQNQRLRIVFAGRRFSNETLTLLDRLKNFSPINLTPFDHDVVTRSIVDFLQQMNYQVTVQNPDMRQLAAHLLFLTGGHPGCMAELIRQYEATHLTVDQFIEVNYDRFLDDVVCPTLDSIFGEIYLGVSDKAVRRFLEVNVLRYIYYPIIEQIIHTFNISGVDHSTDLAIKLTLDHLYEWDERFLEDGIFQQLAFIRLWHHEPENFRRYGRIARRICKAYLKEPTCQRPELWAAEYLYQVLQAHSPYIMDPAVRQRLRGRFFDHFVPGIFNVLIDGRNKTEKLIDLRNFIENDETFQFTLNYYLRENRFTNEPYKNLLTVLGKL